MSSVLLRWTMESSWAAAERWTYASGSWIGGGGLADGGAKYLLLLLLAGLLLLVLWSHTPFGTVVAKIRRRQFFCVLPTSSRHAKAIWVVSNFALHFRLFVCFFFLDNETKEISGICRKIKMRVKPKIDVQIFSQLGLETTFFCSYKELSL